MINSLVAYKGKPARIANIIESKFELEFADGSTLKVREKDFRFIHPEFGQQWQHLNSQSLQIIHLGIEKESRRTNSDNIPTVIPCRLYTPGDREGK